MQALTVRISRCPPNTHSHTLQRQNQQLWCVSSFLWHPCYFLSSDAWGPLPLQLALENGSTTNPGRQRHWEFPLTEVQVAVFRLQGYGSSSHTSLPSGGANTKQLCEATPLHPRTPPLTHSPSSGTLIELKGRLLVNWAPAKMVSFCSLTLSSKTSLTSSTSRSVFWNMLFTVAWMLTSLPSQKERWF